MKLESRILPNSRYVYLYTPLYIHCATYEGLHHEGAARTVSAP